MNLAACRSKPGRKVRKMLGDGFEMATITRTGPDGLTRVVTRRSSGGAQVGARGGAYVCEFHETWLREM
jgi:hypothetical protein